MPIRPEVRWLYPVDWPQLSKMVRFERAKGRCETCGRPHGQQVHHLGDGRWWDEEREVWRDGHGRPVKRLAHYDGGAATHLGLVVRATRVVLAAAHLDHDPTNNRPRNLKALCQRCHLLHDRVEHQRQRYQTLRRRKALGDLFLGRYRYPEPVDRPKASSGHPSIKAKPQFKYRANSRFELRGYPPTLVHYELRIPAEFIYS
jgi:hypothetical protein